MSAQTVPEGVRPGLKGEAVVLVCEHNVAGHVPVFSTPSLVGLAERACINATHRHLPPGFTTVGFEVNVKHLAPTPIGKQVRAVAELTDVQGNKLAFRVEAFDDERKTGEGLLRRALVPAKFGKD